MESTLRVFYFFIIIIIIFPNTNTFLSLFPEGDKQTVHTCILIEINRAHLFHLTALVQIHHERETEKRVCPYGVVVLGMCVE